MRGLLAEMKRYFGGSDNFCPRTSKRRNILAVILNGFLPLVVLINMGFLCSFALFISAIELLVLLRRTSRLNRLANQYFQ